MDTFAVPGKNGARRRGRGFTLIELLIVASITIMLVAFSISYRNTSQQQIGLYVEIQKIAGLILRAKSLAVSTFSDPGLVVTPGFVVCGYGISINYASNNYSLFSYQVPSGTNCTTIARIDRAGVTGIVVNLSTYTLSPAMRLRNAAANSVYDILFVPPDPLTLISIRSDEVFTRPTPTGGVYISGTAGGVASSISISPIGQVSF